MKEKKERSVAPALDGGLSILELLADHPEGVGFSEILERSACSRATVARLLHVLGGRGYVMKDGRTGRYFAGLQMANLAGGQPWFGLLRQRAHRVLSAVAEETGNTVILLIRDGIYLRSIGKVLNPESIVMQEIGVRNEDPCGTPWGAIQLVEFGLEEGKGPEWMAGRYPKASAYPEPWVREYVQRGWVLDDGKRFKGVRRIAVPVFDESRKLMGVLALGGTLGSIPAGKIEPFSGILSRYAAVLRDAWKDII